MNIQETVQKQKLYFQKGNTFPVSSRIKALKALLAAVNAWEDKILAALRSDLNKSPAEAYMTEIGMVKEEISFQLKHLKKFAAKKRVKTPLAQFKAKSYTYPAPYGVVLIMSPWNYPFQLTLAPLADAIAAGNCAVVKPSAYAPQTAQVIADLLKETFDPDHIAVILGGRAENTELIQQKYDMIFFTGGSSTGRVVAEAAAKNLTPVVLELGGKSPCIVNEDANIPLAARRIAFGKFLNAGRLASRPTTFSCTGRYTRRFWRRSKRTSSTCTAKTRSQIPTIRKSLTQSILHGSCRSSRPIKSCSAEIPMRAL